MITFVFLGTLWRHLARLLNNRKQDGVIFVDTEGLENRGLVEKLALRVPAIFRSNYPVFMHTAYSNILDLRLDFNVIFYEVEDDKIRLLDKFSVLGGAPIVLEVGIWQRFHGVKLSERKNRWERRTNLLGASITNGLTTDSDVASPIFDENGNLTGSEGWYPEILTYITDHINMSVNPMIDLTDGDYHCYRLLDRKLADVCTAEMFLDIVAFQQIHPIKRDKMTLLVGVQTERAIDSWVFIEVFGYWQWFIIFSFLALIALLWPIMVICLEVNENNSKKSVFGNGFSSVFLYLIQNGEHPSSRFLARRMLSITASMITLIIFIYYCNDITSKMTAGPPPLNINTFGDAFNQGYKIITKGYLHWSELKDAKPGTWRNKIYNKDFSQYEEIIAEYNAFYQGQDEEDYLKELKFDKIDMVPKWFFDTVENGAWAAETLNDNKALWFGDESWQHLDRYKGKVKSLKLRDATPKNKGFALQSSSSEFLPLFNHYLIKAQENGILHRLELFHNFRQNMKIGISEPAPLDIFNVMFLFSLLGVSIITSMMTVLVEKLHGMMLVNKNVKKK